MGSLQYFLTMPRELRILLDEFKQYAEAFDSITLEFGIGRYSGEFIVLPPDGPKLHRIKAGPLFEILPDAEPKLYPGSVMNTDTPLEGYQGTNYWISCTPKITEIQYGLDRQLITFTGQRGLCFQNKLRAALEVYREYAQRRREFERLTATLDGRTF